MRQMKKKKQTKTEKLQKLFPRISIFVQVVPYDSFSASFRHSNVTLTFYILRSNISFLLQVKGQEWQIYGCAKIIMWIKIKQNLKKSLVSSSHSLNLMSFEVTLILIPVQGLSHHNYICLISQITFQLWGIFETLFQNNCLEHQGQMNQLFPCPIQRQRPCRIHQKHEKLEWSKLGSTMLRNSD